MPIPNPRLPGNLEPQAHPPAVPQYRVIAPMRPKQLAVASWPIAYATLARRSSSAPASWTRRHSSLWHGFPLLKSRAVRA
jgi:hypothetical protein